MTRYVAVLALLSGCVFQLQAAQETVVRKYLWCPEGPLAHEPLRGETGWAFHELTGCERAAWCGDHDGRWECRAPDILALAVKQLSVESGCPANQIAQVQRFAVDTQHTYRLSACGQEYACIVPVAFPRDARGHEKTNETRVAASVFGSQMTCKQIPKAAAAAPASSAPEAPPPPPPPSN